MYLIGAPRCGTTSVAAALQRHPRIYLGRGKEPCYLNEDFGPRKLTTYRAYARHYRGAAPHHELFCDASTTYLYSCAARARIAHLHEARVLVMLRDPVDMALSWFAQKRLSLEENLDDFESAWRAIPRRRRGIGLPSRLRERRWLYYDEMAAIGTAARDWVDALGPERVKPMLLDDLRSVPARFFGELFAFLGLAAPEGLSAHTRKNARHRHRSPLAAKALSAAGELRARALPRGLGVNLLAKMQRLNQAPQPGTRRIDASFEAELIAHFAPQVRIIEQMTGRSLAAWQRRRAVGGGADD